jgi:hypothetical protein
MTLLVQIDAVLCLNRALSKLKMSQVGRDYYLPEGAVAIREHK